MSDQEQSRRRQWHRLAGCAAMLATLVCAPVRAEDNPDPWEGFNRSMFAFNDTLDTWVLRPVAVAYHDWTPDPVEGGIANFLDNLLEVRTILNDLLQAKWQQAGHDSARFVVNTTVGIFGFIDVGTRIGLDAHDEDFGQTLATWGVPSGPYLMLPLLGPSTVRDTAGSVPEYALNAQDQLTEAYFGVDNAAPVLGVTYAVSKRAELLEYDALLMGDKYAQMRDAWLQRRAFMINDGQVSEDLLEEDLGEDFFEE